MSVTLKAPFKVYATEYVRELVRDPFGRWMSGWRVVEEAWISLTGDTHQWNDGYGIRNDEIAKDGNGTLYLHYRNYIDYTGGGRWMRPTTTLRPATSFETYRELPYNTIGVDGLPLKVREL